MSSDHKPQTALRKPTAEQFEAMVLYADLLHEVNVRIGVVEAIVNGRVLLPSPILHELCFVQMRFLCELIALGCLVVHGDIKLTATGKAAKDGKLKKMWSAELIMEELSTLHTDFYPQPLQLISTPLLSLNTKLSKRIS